MLKSFIFTVIVIVFSIIEIEMLNVIANPVA
jgi:hypothetical protein